MFAHPSTGAVHVFPVPVYEHLLVLTAATINKPKQYFAFNIYDPWLAIGISYNVQSV